MLTVRRPYGFASPSRGTVVAPAAAPTVVGITPSTAAVGAVVYVTGTGFVSGTTCTVGGAALGSLVLDSTTQLHGVVPSGTGVANVVVSNANGSDTLVGGFTYDAGGYQTPNLVNNASFESGWDGFTNSSGGDPTGVSRQTDYASDGVTSARATWAANAGDVGTASFWKTSFAEQDAVWARFYFRLDAGWSITSIQKWCIFREAGFSTQFGGLELNDGLGISWSFFIEGSAVGTSLKAKGDITTGVWHSIEVYYKRNGDAYPWAQFWYDGALLEHVDTAPNAYGIYWSNNELHVSNRASSAKMAQMQLLGTRNGGNTGSGTIWMDKVAISSLGRIGP